MNVRVFVFLFSSGLLFCSGSAWFQGPAGNPEAMFDLMDKNQDGVVSREEFQMYGPGMMGQGRGGMGAGPGRQGMGQGAGRGMGRADDGMPPMFGNLDTDESGTVSLSEMLSFREGVFFAMDEDGDGSLTMEEYMAVRMGPGADPSTRGPRSAQSQSRKEARFPDMDKNQDGRVSSEEFTAYGKESFTRSDLNHDGQLTPAEFRGHSFF